MNKLLGGGLGSSLGSGLGEVWEENLDSSLIRVLRGPLLVNYQLIQSIPLIFIFIALMPTIDLCWLGQSMTESESIPFSFCFSFLSFSYIYSALMLSPHAAFNAVARFHIRAVRRPRSANLSFSSYFISAYLKKAFQSDEPESQVEPKVGRSLRIESDSCPHESDASRVARATSLRSPSLHGDFECRLHCHSLKS